MIKPAYPLSYLLSINIFVWRNVLYFPNDLLIYIYIYIYIIRLASKEIFSPSIKIHWEVGRAKDLSAPLYYRESPVNGLLVSVLLHGATVTISQACLSLHLH